MIFQRRSNKTKDNSRSSVFIPSCRNGKRTEISHLSGIKGERKEAEGNLVSTLILYHMCKNLEKQPLFKKLTKITQKILEIEESTVHFPTKWISDYENAFESIRVLFQSFPNLDKAF